MVGKNILFIEGSADTSNGDLRQGFSKLLAQKVKSGTLKIVLGGGKSQAIKKFKNNKLPTDLALLLIDLDKPETEIEADLVENDLLKQRAEIFYMIQETESWFLSQPNILDDFYGKDNRGKLISEKMPKTKSSDIEKPDKLLQKLSKDTHKGEYHKIKHAVELLKLLDATKLENDIPEFKRLVDRLK